MRYTTEIRPAQGFDRQYLDTVNIIPSSTDLEFFERLFYTDDRDLIKSVVLEECRLGVYDAETMLTVLGNLGVGFPGVELPERVSAPIPSVSSSKPYDPVETSADSDARWASTAAHISSSEGRSPDNASRQSSTSSRSDLSNPTVSMFESPAVCEREFHAWTNRSQATVSGKVQGGGK